MTTYALIENGQITQTGSLLAAFPNTSFPRPLPDSFQGWVKVVIPSVPDGKKMTNDIALVEGVPTRVLVDLDSADKIEVLVAYGSAFEDSELTHNGFTEDGTEEHRRNAKETIDFLREIGENAPASIPWNSPNHGIQIVTLATLVGWLLAVGQRRFKRFTVQSALIPDIEDYDTIAEIQGAFDAAYAA